MTMPKRIAYVEKDCVACGCCVKACPFGAISIYKGMFARVSVQACVGCGKCVKACPADVISIVSREAFACEI